MGSLPELCSDAKQLQDSPSVGVDADARAICSQTPRLLQHKTSDPFPGCVQVISSHSTSPVPSELETLIQGRHDFI